MKGEGEFGSSRYLLFESSYNAASEGGFFGLGYGISHPQIKSLGAGDHYESCRFIREKGNSVLAMIEEVGIVGLILFLLPVIKIVYLFFSSYRKSVISNRLQLRINLSHITHHRVFFTFPFCLLPFYLVSSSTPNLKHGGRVLVVGVY